jgi:stage V sporulation protein D (sporulation-specific penicillin-binding protein)
MSNTQQEQEKTVTEISNILNINEQEVRKYLVADANGKYKAYIPLAKKIDRKIGQIITDKKLKGIWLETNSKRSYPYNTLASHIIGFMGGETGLLGIERKYNEYLKGIAGRSFVLYQDGNDIENEIIEAQDGATIISTIDASIQQFAEEAIINAKAISNPKDAAIIVMNPNTAEILAMASTPNFDLNNAYDLSLQGIDSSKMSDKEKSETLNKIWSNYNISNTYEPGSTFKPMVIAAALEEGIISKTDHFYCSGSRQVVDGEKPIKCWKTTGHGDQTVEDVLANSCNVAMMQIGEKMGPEVFYKYQKAFGFGEKTGIDLPGEASAESLLHSLDSINKVELATMSFGQTFNATPIQLINAFAAVINGGNLMKPYTVSQIVDSASKVVFQNKPTIERKVISKSTSDIVRQYLQAVVDRGTGQKAKIEGYEIGGKTGTAEQGVRSQSQYVLSFVGFLPIDNPKVIALALLDRPKEQDQGSAGPMLKELLEKTIRYMGIEATHNATNAQIKSKDIVLDDYTNRPLMEATTSLSMLNLNYEIFGSGSVVVNQVPKAGEAVKAGTKVMIYVTKSENGQKVIVPNLKSKTYEEAMTLLKQLGLVSTVEGKQDGKIVEQEPKEGSSIDVGGSVRIKFQK